MEQFATWDNSFYGVNKEMDTVFSKLIMNQFLIEVMAFIDALLDEQFPMLDHLRDDFSWQTQTFLSPRTGAEEELCLQSCRTLYW